MKKGRSKLNGTLPPSQPVPEIPPEERLKSFVDVVFGGQLASILICEECKNVRHSSFGLRSPSGIHRVFGVYCRYRSPTNPLMTYPYLSRMTSQKNANETDCERSSRNSVFPPTPIRPVLNLSLQTPYSDLRTRNRCRQNPMHEEEAWTIPRVQKQHRQ